MEMMIRIVLLFVAIFKASAFNAADYESEFEAFLTKYKTSYSHASPNATEKAYRLNVFATNLLKIEALNQREKVVNLRADRATFGITKFSNWTDEELRGLTGYKPAASVRNKYRFSTRRSGLCSTNWASRNSMRNQGRCGNCWTFSTSEAVRSAYQQQNGADPGELSTQYLTDCMYQGLNCSGGVNGCCGGNPADAMAWLSQNGGIPTKEAYGDYTNSGRRMLQVGPVSIAGGGDTFSGNAPTTAYPCKSGISAAVTLAAPKQMESEADMAAYACNTGSLSIAVDASKWSFYTGGVMTASSCGTSLDHAVLLVGANAQDNTWIVQNSWGYDWGENLQGQSHVLDGVNGGYIRLEYGKNTCGIAEDAVAVVGTARAEYTLTPTAVSLQSPSVSLGKDPANYLPPGSSPSPSSSSGIGPGAMVGICIAIGGASALVTGMSLYWYLKKKHYEPEPDDALNGYQAMDSALISHEADATSGL